MIDYTFLRFGEMSNLYSAKCKILPFGEVTKHPYTQTPCRDLTLLNNARDLGVFWWWWRGQCYLTEFPIISSLQHNIQLPSSLVSCHHEGLQSCCGMFLPVLNIEVFKLLYCFRVLNYSKFKLSWVRRQFHF